MNRNMEAITWALHARGISPTAFRLLIQLCGCVNSTREDFDVWPSHKWLADKVEVSTSGIKRHLAELVDAGYLLVRPSERGDGSTSVNIYTIGVRTRHKLPDGGQVTLTPPIGQSGLGGSSPVNGAQVNAEPCNEPLKGTSEIERTPLSYGEDTPTAANDLFGEEVQAPEIDLADRVLDEWHKLAKEVPGIADVRALDPARRKKIKDRAGLFKTEGTPWTVWQRVFAAIRANTYLRGEDEPGRGYTDPFRLRLDYVLRKDEFMKIYEGGYRANRTAETHDPVTGRRYGPTEQIGRAAVARIRASADEPRDGVDHGGGGEVNGSGGHRPRRLRSAFDAFGIDPTR